MQFHTLSTAVNDPWTGSVSATDGLPLRDSGSWIQEKHRSLVYFAKMFSTGMKPTEHKTGWANRVYLELFSGPGKCLVRETGEETAGSPLQVIGNEFTRFIFVDIDTSAAKALEQRLAGHPNADKVEIWNGDCAEAINRMVLPEGALTLAFIDPTGISQAPFELIRKLSQKTRCDLLINIQHAMGIKMNMHQYRPDADIDCALTRFLGDETWKPLLGSSPQKFFADYLELYRKKLAAAGFPHSKNHVTVNMKRRLPLYLLLFASAHPLGQEFWNKAVSGSDPQFTLDF
jgi:three-Cys-motif partner protein